MPTFKSKPVLIEAEQFFHDKPLPFALKGPYVASVDGTFYVVTNNRNRAALHDGDWVVLEPTGPHTPSFAAYPVRADIFESRWARVGAEPSPDPAHFEAVTAIENSMRGFNPMAINARKTHCPQGHEYSPSNTAWNGRKRFCLACRQAKDARALSAAGRCVRCGKASPTYRCHDCRRKHNASNRGRSR